EGRWEDKYPSQSEADSALVFYFAYFTGPNRPQLQRLFRRSGLMRDKWDEQRGGRTYGQLTIDNALEKVTKFWSQAGAAAKAEERAASEEAKRAASEEEGTAANAAAAAAGSNRAGSKTSTSSSGKPAPVRLETIRADVLAAMELPPSRPAVRGLLEEGLS